MRRDRHAAEPTCGTSRLRRHAGYRGRRQQRERRVRGGGARPAATRDILRWGEIHARAHTHTYTLACQCHEPVVHVQIRPHSKVARSGEHTPSSTTSCRHRRLACLRVLLIQGQECLQYPLNIILATPDKLRQLLNADIALCVRT